jgi:hypothetical protein
LTKGQDSAEILALRALGWIATSEDLLPVFLGATGLAAGELQDRADEPDFLASVLDFLLMDDAWIVAFCDAEGLGYDAPLRARAALPGSAVADWA